MPDPLPNSGRAIHALGIDAIANLQAYAFFPVLSVSLALVLGAELRALPLLSCHVNG
jgi:hypothetical protein